jgi:hypothetical protein
MYIYSLLYGLFFGMVRRRWNSEIKIGFSSAFRSMFISSSKMIVVLKSYYKQGFPGSGGGEAACLLLAPLL